MKKYTYLIIMLVSTAFATHALADGNVQPLGPYQTHLSGAPTHRTTACMTACGPYIHIKGLRVCYNDGTLLCNGYKIKHPNMKVSTCC